MGIQSIQSLIMQPMLFIVVLYIKLLNNFGIDTSNNHPSILILNNMIHQSCYLLFSYVHGGRQAAK